MLQFDQENGQVRRSAFGPAGVAGPGQAIDELAREIEDTQRQQSETMAHIVERLRTFNASRTPSEPAHEHEPDPAETPAPPSREHVMLDPAGDEPWDADTAEALTQSYEEHPEPVARAATEAMTYIQQAWIGERFSDLSQKIMQAISDLQPSSTVTLLEERLDAFQAHIAEALRDVVRRDDLEGMRLIEVHVNDLGDKLDELEQHVSRIDRIESDVRNVIDQVSDERITKLFDYDSRFAADLEAVAKRAAEEVRFAHESEPSTTDTRRHDELRALIEASIQDRREAEVQAVSLVTGLSGRVSAQSDRYDELKGLMEQAIQEQRQNEQTAFGMLDTLQQALVTILDRMDALEQQGTPLPAPATREHARSTDRDPPSGDDEPGAPFPSDPSVSSEAPYTFRDTRFDSTFSAKDELEGPAPASALVEVATAFAEQAEPAEYVVSEEADSPIERLRRDFIADARRAKLKATANRAEEAASPKAEEKKPNSVAQARAALTQTLRPAQTGGSGRLFGMSTKLLAGVLALIIAINGGLLLFGRKSAPPQIAPPPAAMAPQAPATDGASDGSSATPEPPSGTHAPGPRSDLGGGALPPYGYQDDVLNPPEVETLGDAIPAGPPGGTAIAHPAGSVPDEVVATIYEQQVLAGLSGQLGMIAAGQSASAMLPEASGRIDATFTPSELTPASEGSKSASALDMPPATVGPMSLRLAAANGDPSAEFEVAARLAEGNGTGQNYAQALHWYQRSAAKGFAQAQYRLGTLYERGLGVDKDIERAKIWYGRAAEQGNVKSMHNLAVLNTSGEKGEPDFAAAAPWFLKAAEHGLADSQYNLGVLLENGLGGTTDRMAAYKWYALAAKGGDQDATQRRDALKTRLSADALKTAEGQIATFRARPASPLANDARAAGEDWKKRVHNDTNT